MLFDSFIDLLNGFYALILNKLSEFAVYLPTSARDFFDFICGIFAYLLGTNFVINFFFVSFSNIALYFTIKFIKWAKP